MPTSGSKWVIRAEDPPDLEVVGERGRFPITRIWCVGRNYAAHAREMKAAGVAGSQFEAPFFFLKPTSALLPGGGRVPYPSRTGELHHEVELVVGLGRGGRNVDPRVAPELIYGFAVGLDLTRRDVQAEAKARGRPWSLAKGFDHSAPCSAIVPREQVGSVDRGRLTLTVNGALKQEGDLSEMIWGIPRLLSALSREVALLPGDLVYTGTPAGVGPIVPGDVVVGAIEGIGSVRIEVTRGA